MISESVFDMLLATYMSSSEKLYINVGDSPDSVLGPHLISHTFTIYVMKLHDFIYLAQTSASFMSTNLAYLLT